MAILLRMNLEIETKKIVEGIFELQCIQENLEASKRIKDVNFILLEVYQLFV